MGLVLFSQFSGTFSSEIVEDAHLFRVELVAEDFQLFVSGYEALELFVTQILDFGRDGFEGTLEPSSERLVIRFRPECHSVRLLIRRQS